MAEKLKKLRTVDNTEAVAQLYHAMAHASMAERAFYRLGQISHSIEAGKVAQLVKHLLEVTE